MRVAVLGSWRREDVSDWELREESAFAQACRHIGHEVVARGHSLIVGTDSLHTADGHAALGAMEVLQNLPGKRTRIIVVRLRTPKQDPKPEPPPFDELRRANPGVFVSHFVDAASDAAVKLIQTQLADAVVLVGGAWKTELAGLTAAAGRRPLTCIGSFGGAAFRLNERFVNCPNTWGYELWETAQLESLQEPFNDSVLDTALTRAGIQGTPKLMIIHGHSRDREELKRKLDESNLVGPVIVLAEKLTPTEPIPIKFERFAATVDGAIALVTPDDPGARARENVWVEVGWFWGRRGRDKLLLLTKENVTIPSDLGGVESVEYASSPVDDECWTRIKAFIERLRSGSEHTSAD